MISIKGLYKQFGQLEVLKGIDLEVEKGQVVVVIGPSGSGKTTMLRCLNVLETPTNGIISIEGQSLDFSKPVAKKNISTFRRLTGMVFQNYNLFPHKTALENVMEGPVVVKGESKESARNKALSLLEKVGLGDKVDYYPAQLSGGQQQRVGLAMAFACRPPVIVLDEPTTGLDVTTQAHVLDTVRDLCAIHRVAALYVSHDLAVIASLATRVAVMYAGRIVEIGPVADVIHRPAHPYTVGLMGSIPAVGQDVERLPQIEGSMPRLNAIPPGCAFNPRCPRVFDRCRVERPGLMPANKTQAACWLHAVKETALA